MIPFGCEDKNRTPEPEDRVCPKCGREVEVFVLRGRVAEESICECGYVFQVEEPGITIPDKREGAVGK